jgi:hypothetical protein
MSAASTVALALSAAMLAGCAAESPEASNQETASRAVEATGLPDRDLTLQTPMTPALAIASPVELSRPILEPQPAPRPKVSPKRSPAPAPVPAPSPAPDALPATDTVVSVSTAAAQVVSEPATVADATVGVGRELAPGKTVTIIPAASGPSSSPEEPSWAPSGPGRSVIVGSGGGTCRPRGGARGIGIAGRIPIGVPGRRLR